MIRDVRTVSTYWKKEHTINDSQFKIMKVIKYSNYPIVTQMDLIKQLGISEHMVHRETTLLIKTRMIRLEKRGKHLTYFLTRNGRENLLKWE